MKAHAKTLSRLAFCAAIGAAAACSKEVKEVRKVPGLPGTAGGPGGKGDLVQAARDAATGDAPRASTVAAASRPGEAGVPEIVLPQGAGDLGDPAQATFTVPATTYSNPTGWFLRKDEHVKIKVAGGAETWTCDKANRPGHGPAGVKEWDDWEGCRGGSFVAHVITNTTEWIDKVLCVGGEAEIVAPFDGALALGPNDGGVADNDGALTVDVRRVVPQPASPPAAVAPELSYGVRRVTVDAKQKWTSTGLYLRVGDTVGVQTRGGVRIAPDATEDTGPEGLWWFYEGCPAAMLRGVVANFAGGTWNEQKICLGRDSVFAAEQEGVLFLGVVDSWYPDNTGAFTANVTSAARYIPTVGADYDFAFDPRLDGQAATAYGRRVVSVPANQAWTNTGLYLKTGQKAHIEARGEWSYYGGGAGGPEGAGGNPYQGCAYNTLRAVIGLDLEENWEKRLVCVGSALDLTAARDGILFLGNTDDTGYLYDNENAMTVVISSDADAAPVLPLARVAAFDWATVGSGWAEIAGKHVSFTVPVDAAKAAGGEALVKAVGQADQWYESVQALEGKGAEKTGRLRFYPDPGLAGTGRVLIAGNPVRVDPAAFTAEGTEGPGGIKLLALADGGDPKHEVLHALAVAMAMSLQGGRYAPGGGVIEAWGDLLTRYVTAASDDPCATDETKDFLETGTFDELTYARVPVYCLLAGLQGRYGWPFYTKFFEAFHEGAQDGIPQRWDDRKKRWDYVRQTMSAAAGADVTAELQKFKVEFP